MVQLNLTTNTLDYLLQKFVAVEMAFEYLLHKLSCGMVKIAFVYL